MNNAFLSIEIEPNVDNTVRFREKETELVAIIEALETIAASKEWAVLKEKVWDGVGESLNRQLMTEVKKKPLNGPLIHSINGQIVWTEKYLDISKLADIYKLELQNIRKNLKEDGISKGA